MTRMLLWIGLIVWINYAYAPLLRSNMQPVGPIMVLDLFPQERKQLLELFSDLSEEDWDAPTVCQGWTVKDIGLHLLGDDIGYLSGRRDHFSNPFFRNKDMHAWESLVKNLNEANELWVKAAERISPKLLSVLLALTGKQLYEYMQSLDPMAINGVVSWAVPDPAPVVELQPGAIVTMDQETCWRLFTKGMSKDQAKANTTIEGDQKLGEKILDTVSIIA